MRIVEKYNKISIVDTINSNTLRVLMCTLNNTVTNELI